MDNSVLLTVLQGIAMQFVESLPTVFTLALLIGSGWLVARITAGLVRRFVIRVGLNKAFESSDFAQELNKIQPGRSLADLIAGATFWLLWLYLIISAVALSGISLEAGVFSAILLFLPRLFAAFLILVGGALLAQFIGRWVQVGVAAAGVEFHEAIGKGARFLLIVMAVITAVEELGVDLTPLTSTLTNLLTVTIAGLALAFGLGARDIVRNILAGYYAREHFELGDTVTFEGTSGVLDAIGAVNAEILTESGRVVLPNSYLTEKIITVVQK